MSAFATTKSKPRYAVSSDTLGSSASSDQNPRRLGNAADPREEARPADAVGASRFLRRETRELRPRGGQRGEGGLRRLERRVEREGVPKRGLRIVQGERVHEEESNRHVDARIVGAHARRAFGRPRRRRRSRPASRSSRRDSRARGRSGSPQAGPACASVRADEAWSRRARSNSALERRTLARALLALVLWG